MRGLIDRVELRGAALLLCGVGWTAYGVGILTDPRYGVSRGAAILTKLWPLDWWAVVWIAAGVICLGAAFCRTGPDRLGYGAAVLPPGLWALAYIVAWASGQYPVAWASTPAWLVPVGLLAIIAALSARLTLAERRVRKLEGSSDGG